ncbi:MAG: SMP-30/gluconolactonase/LRE family protein [Candidatus Bathyarchaeota archaeon]|nr:SMP-30/gluconolactonase/LRE family protein [Candidatus Bathyarchaeota archaeon]
MPKASRLGEIVPNPQVEKILGGFQFTEGPLWAEGRLLFSDIPASTIYSWTPGVGRAEVYRRPSGRSNGLTLDGRGRLIACEHDRRLTRTEPDGAVKVLAESYEGKRLNSPNDAVVARSGAIYFTDPPYGLGDKCEGKELPYQGVYRLGLRGKLILLDDTFERPNGLAFSPNESMLYIDDTAKRHIRVFDVRRDGSICNGRLFAELKGPKPGNPDGMKVDIHGNVYCTGSGGVWVIDPSGEPLGVIEVPQVTSNVAWGDADFKTLYITAQTSVYRVRTTSGCAPF